MLLFLTLVYHFIYNFQPIFVYHIFLVSNTMALKESLNQSFEESKGSQGPGIVSFIYFMYFIVFNCLFISF